MRNPSLSCVSLCDDLKFPFFLSPNPFTYRSYFLLDKSFGNTIQIKIFLFECSVCKSLKNAFAVKRDASTIKKVISERKGEREEKSK